MCITVVCLGEWVCKWYTASNRCVGLFHKLIRTQTEHMYCCSCNFVIVLVVIHFPLHFFLNIFYKFISIQAAYFQAYGQSQRVRGELRFQRAFIISTVYLLHFISFHFCSLLFRYTFLITWNAVAVAFIPFHSNFAIVLFHVFIQIHSLCVTFHLLCVY